MELADIKEAALSGFVAVCAIIGYVFKRKSSSSAKEQQTIHKENHNQKNDQHRNSGTIISGSGHTISIGEGEGDKKKNMHVKTNDEIREKCNVLFIDDQPYTMPKLLNRNGWKKVKIVKDVNRIDDPDIIDADVILVDILGVGESMGFTDQGLGLADALKSEYNQQKKIIIYSQEDKGDRFHPALGNADKCLKKSIGVYQLETILFSMMRDK